MECFGKAPLHFFWFNRLEDDFTSCFLEEFKHSPASAQTKVSEVSCPDILALQRLRFCGKGQQYPVFVWRHMHTTCMNYFICKSTVSTWATSSNNTRWSEWEERRAAPLALRKKAAKTRAVDREEDGPGEGILTENKNLKFSVFYLIHSVQNPEH